ncbi:hypothetical protein [Clostridium isatidis]|uniref:Uncharacterized protein n=1 Tax=Clostridium isatidis TaxID=182773 RepID=A0A343JA16_9CLOT|nr:hypothetical protein [Clostridium isatidis]ASW42374.1 hypothetical protein BEN51_02390 [Clostridium isatidis]
MWNENIEFYVTLARPKAGVRFEEGNEYANDLEDAVKQANDEWKGDRIFEIIEYSGISVKMAYRALDLIRGERTLTRYLQKISQILAYDKQWNERVTRKEGTIFTVQIVHKSIEDNIESADILEDEPTSKELLKQILEVLIDIREEIRK